MTNRPILFSALMVRALLARRKRQTRRDIKLPTKGEYVREDIGGWEPTIFGGHGVRTTLGEPVPEKVAIWNRTTGTTLCLPYQTGDRLWVREAWRTAAHYDDLKPSEMG